MRWANPENFYFIGAIGIVFFLSWLWLKLKARKTKVVFDARLLPLLTQSHSPQRALWKNILQVTTVILLALAMARPQSGKSATTIRSEGVEVMLLIDVSNSMMAEDIKPNRLEQAKIEMSRLIDLMPGNRVGVIAFAGSATLVSPITNDPGSIKMFLESLTTGAVSNQGTSFQTALSYAKEAFERGGVTSDASQRVTRVVIMASDGEDQETGAVDMVKEMIKAGIRLFTIAYGTEKGGQIPVRDQMGFLRDYKKNEETGQPVITSVKGVALKELAKVGQGEFYFSTFGGDHLKKIIERVETLEKTRFDSESTMEYAENFQYFALAALLMLLIEIFLGERRNEFRIWRGRFEPSNQ